MSKPTPIRSIAPAIGPDLPSALFQQLSSEYPDLSRRIVGDVLGRVQTEMTIRGTPANLSRVQTSARELLDATRIRTAAASERVGLSG